MMKNGETETVQKPKNASGKVFIIKLTVLAALAAAAYGIWKNPQIFNQIRGYFAQPSQEVPFSEPDYAQQIQNLENRVEDLQKQLLQTQNVLNPVSEAGLSDLSARMDILEKNNLNAINSKADAAVVLGLVTRMDEAEDRLDTLAKVTDKGALILTAVMLVKDSAERGGSFEYETEVLKQIAAGDVKIKEPLSVIEKNAGGLVSETQLKRDFARLYPQMLKTEKQALDASWTERINSKLGQIVKIKRVDGDKSEGDSLGGLEKVKEDVETSDFAAAVGELEKPENASLRENAALAAWMEKAKTAKHFLTRSLKSAPDHWQ